MGKLPQNESFAAELRTIAPKLKRLEASVAAIIRDGLSGSNIATLPISVRVKELESAIEKANAKSYRNPIAETTDLVGCRIICYLDSDVSTIESIIKSLFHIDNANSSNKRDSRTVNTVGYRSLHLICTLGSKRNDLPEYSDICEIKFEVQIRTVLEHAWAEIEHKQNYKSRKSLPPELQRRLNIISGTLELVDRELSNIALEALQYQGMLIEQGVESEQEPISVAAVLAVVETFNADGLGPSLDRNLKYDDVLENLERFGIHSVGDLKSLLSQVPLEKSNIAKKWSVRGFIHTAMALSDLKKFKERIMDATGMQMPSRVYKFIQENSRGIVDGILEPRDIDSDTEL